MHKPFDSYDPRYFPKGSCTQRFGENPDLYKLWGLKYHNGEDHVAYKGAPIYAVEGGEVIDSKDDPNGYGRCVRILSEDREWTYGHLDTVKVKLGAEVAEGQVIGTMGNTGFVQSGTNAWWGDNQAPGNDGTHLHLGLRIAKRDPKGFLYIGGAKTRVTILNYDNGVKGAIDPRPFLSIPLLKKLVGLLQELIKLK